MNSIITRALMRYHNNFFKMTEEEQEIFKLQEHEELDAKVSEFVNKEIDFVDSRDEHNSKKLLERNKIALHYNGIGPNYFTLNEFGDADDVLKFKNLYDYNENKHNFQEDGWAEDTPDYKKLELFNRLSEWARAEIDGKFNYINIFSYQIWIYYALEAFESEWIEDHIPYEYVSGPENGKKTKGGTIWDMHPDANGKEGWLEQMRDFARDWTTAWYDKEIHENKWDVVFINDTSGQDFIGDPNMEYIFGSIDTLKKVSFRTFVDDCEKLKGDSEIAYQYRDNIIKELRVALEEKFVEVQKSPPGEMKVRTKESMTVKMADGAIDDMIKISQMDEDGDL